MAAAPSSRRRSCGLDTPYQTGVTRRADPGTHCATQTNNGIGLGAPLPGRQPNHHPCTPLGLPSKTPRPYAAVNSAPSARSHSPFPGRKSWKGAGKRQMLRSKHPVIQVDCTGPSLHAAHLGRSPLKGSLSPCPTELHSPIQKPTVYRRQQTYTNSSPRRPKQTWTSGSFQEQHTKSCSLQISGKKTPYKIIFPRFSVQRGRGRSIPGAGAIFGLSNGTSKGAARLPCHSVSA